MNMTSAFLDPEMGMTTFAVRRLTYEFNSNSDPSEETFLGVLGSIHPAAPEQLELLPEEERHDDYIYVHTEFACQLGKDLRDKMVAPDRIIWNGAQWRVVRVKDWSVFGFYNVLAVRMQEGET